MTPICTFSAATLRALMLIAARSSAQPCTKGVYVEPASSMLVAGQAFGLIFTQQHFYIGKAAPFVIPRAACDQARRIIGNRKVDITVSIGERDKDNLRKLLLDLTVGTVADFSELPGPLPQYWSLVPDSKARGPAADYCHEMLALQRRALAMLKGCELKALRTKLQYNGSSPALLTCGKDQPHFGVAIPEHMDEDTSTWAESTLRRCGLFDKHIARCA